MPYQTIKLSQLITNIGVILDDADLVYWPAQQVQQAINEALRVWGAYTNYWRERGTFATSPATTFYKMDTLLPVLRSRTWTLGQMVQDIQYMLQEAPNGISGAGMSGQVSIGNILLAIQYARDRFVRDVCFPYSITANTPPTPPDGMVTFPANIAYVHRVGWKDAWTGTWTNLWRQDAWATDHNYPQWTINPDAPDSYSEAENAPLKLQITPPPSNQGVAEVIGVNSLTLDTTNANQTFDIPDEWIHAVKYCSLANLLSPGNQISDSMRSAYCDQRYQQAVSMAKDARSILRVLCNGVPLSLDTLAAIDASSPYWRNMVGPPQSAGSLYDILAFNPGVLDQTYGIAVDVVRSAPLPNSNDYIQIGQEELDSLTAYICHVLTFKCGGKDFSETMSMYDEFMTAVSLRRVSTLPRSST